jgi:NADH-quinone oxidoreductase subunit K
MVPVSWYLVLGAVLFALGLVGVLVRRNVVVMLMSVELMINAVNLNLVAFSNLHAHYTGLVLALFVIGVEAAELGVALAVILAWHRHRGALDADGATGLRG